MSLDLMLSPDAVAFSTWLQQAGAGNDLIAQAMGHTATASGAA